MDTQGHESKDQKSKHIYLCLNIFKHIYLCMHENLVYNSDSFINQRLTNLCQRCWKLIIHMQ